MHNLLRCRRGSAAFATVAAMVPLIGVVALGGEAGSWYVTKQHAQNAADAAAYSGALRVGCSIPGKCDTAQDYVYRGKQFAARNAFCNAGDSSYPGSNCATSLPAGTSQTVQIDQPTSSRVRAIVSQHQPGYLSGVLGLFPDGVDIRAQAVAEVQKNPKELCFLGLNGLTIGGSSTISGNGCGMMSNTDVKYNSTPNFSGPGWAVNAVSGCVASAGHCDDVGVPHNYNTVLPATNPLQVLDTESFNNRTGSTKTCTSKTCSLTPNSTGAYGNLTVSTGDTVNFAPGTYFFYDAAIKINGGTVTGTDVTFVLLGDSSLSISGGTVDLSAPAINTTSSHLNGVLIDDQAPNKSKNAVTVNGGGTVKLGGAMYFPNVDVNWGGTTASSFTTCSMVIANTLTINGNAYLSTNGCDPDLKENSKQPPVVALVQ
jgi:hypothetical protein